MITIFCGTNRPGSYSSKVAKFYSKQLTDKGIEHNYFTLEDMPQDLLKNVIAVMGGRVSHVLVKELDDGIFHASLFIDIKGELKEIDCRPSDAIALAVRVKVPIFVAEAVMDEAGVEPEQDIQEQAKPQEEEAGPENLDIFSSFVDTLDFDDFEE